MYMPGPPSEYDHVDERLGFHNVAETPRPASECEWKPFDLVQKRSGPHNLNRSGYDEEKCRNVLVRFCAHVPRNFQYKDGIQQIFLILREHLGDENLDLAGGVLYELIEIDCEHTDDPGAAFQRWRHDHMYRYADLELPHIPHMTTITSSIVPTERLTRWRLEHANRYRFVLSDSTPNAKGESVDPSCIRNKKAWRIDHTLFMSTRSEGTRPLRSPNPQEFHQMQWDSEYGTTGRFVEERQLPISPPGRSNEASPPSSADTSMIPTRRSHRLRHSFSSISIFEKLVEKLGKQSKEPEIQQRRRSWMPNSLSSDSHSTFDERHTQGKEVSVPWPEEFHIPNAIFARKFLIVDTGETLPQNLPISQMPTAESKATETIVEAATTGLLTRTSSWLFRGPFTPQLGFDGGLDYQWSPQDAAVTVRRFDLEVPISENTNKCQHQSSGEVELSRYDSQFKSQPSSSKRSGRVFDPESAPELKACAETYNALDEPNSPIMRDFTSPQQMSLLPSYPPDQSARSNNTLTGAIRGSPSERQQECPQNAQLFDNIEFQIGFELHNVCGSGSNRQTTIIERPDKDDATNPLGLRSPVMYRDPQYNEDMMRLRPRSEICPEENRARLENRRLSGRYSLNENTIVYPSFRETRLSPEVTHEEEEEVTHDDVANNDVADASLAEHDYQGSADITQEDYTSLGSPRDASAPLVGTPAHPLDNTGTSDPLSSHSPEAELDRASCCCSGTPSPKTPPGSHSPEFDSSYYNDVPHNTIDGTPSLASEDIAINQSPLYCNYPNHCALSLPMPPASAYMAQKDSNPSRLSRDQSIRVVKPDFTLTPPKRVREAATMRGNSRPGQKGEGYAEGSRSRSRATNEHPSGSHSRSASEHQQSLDALQGYVAGSSQSKPESSNRHGNVRSESSDRGRTMQRRYEFNDSDDQPQALLSPVQESGKNTDSQDGEGNVTTITDIMNRLKEPSLPELPLRRLERERNQRERNQREGQVNAEGDPSGTQPSAAQQKDKPRPAPLNLKHPVHCGKVVYANQYQLEHNAIKSSKAELCGHDEDWYAPDPQDRVYDERPEPVIPPMPINNVEDARNMNPLDYYEAWHANQRAGSSSAGPSNATAPRQQDDDDRLPIADYPVASDTPHVNHVRSRSAMGIREDRDREHGRRQVSDNPVYSPSEYDPTPVGHGPGMTKSATMHELPHHERKFSNVSETQTSENGITLEESSKGKGKAKGKEVEVFPPPFTPLTPFIMEANGAPAGTAGGSKTLFGENGWLDDTAAASTSTKPKAEEKTKKSSNFMDTLMRKTRQIAGGTPFRPTRNLRQGPAVARINTSLNPREQSLTYMELEYCLSNALDAYFTTQFNCGRLDPSKLSRIANAWASKGRPRVVSFRYDLETQIDLIIVHVDSFRFYGLVNARGEAAVRGLLQAMKTNARYMRIRTLCQPDSVIAKHILDAQNLVRTLGSQESMQRDLERVAQFFKVAVDRYRIAMENPPIGRNREFSNTTGRLTSHGSSEHRVRFQDGTNVEEPPRQYGPGYGVNTAAGRSRPDLREQYRGAAAAASSSSSRPVKPQREAHGAQQKRS
ncbi:hypothetical protein F4808DRAFT_458720 [Astrocystis sublimbata]|nr:hypothetical protein F4808DRAFT_458720 [Astrocystis sublimbata]